MVSNVLDMTPAQLTAALEHLRASHSADTDYQDLRADLPEDWPI